MPGRRAAGLVTSLAPTTSTTSVAGNSGLISSRSFSCGYGAFASASSTFMCPGIRPATGWIAVADVDAVLAPAACASSTHLVLRLRRGQAVPGHDDDLRRVRQLQRRVVGGDLAHRAAAAAAGAGPLVAGAEAAGDDARRSERFIASAISLVRMPPAAPTSAPAMISGVLPSTKPAIATAVPVKAFSSEMTTGMSAPPIGSVISTPSASAATASTTSTGDPGRAVSAISAASRDQRPAPSRS